jgi:RNA polymerase sigma-70 factor (ECF subfamily)
MPIDFAPAGFFAGRFAPDARAVGEVEPASAAWERERLTRALDGDGPAFAELVEPHLPTMFRIAARLCQSPALAEDAVQDALTVAYRRLGVYRAGTSMRAFLSAIAAGQAETLLRSERRRKRREEHTLALDREPTPADELEAKDLAALLRRALFALPAKRRQVALLRLDAGLSYAEIAQALGTTEASARSLTHLALTALKDALSQAESEAASGGGRTL